jgi:Pectate lyase superfamily protein
MTVADVTQHGADPTGASDSSAAFAAAQATGLPVYAPQGTYRLVTTYAPGANGVLIGDGMGRTILKWGGAASNIVMNAPGGYGYIDGVTIDGNNVAGVSGIVGSAAVAGSKPYGCSWGAYEIKNCPGTGLRLTAQATKGIFYCDFGFAYLNHCGVGTLLETSDTTIHWCNNNHFSSLKLGSCPTAGLRLDRASGLVVDSIRAEACGTGIDVVSGSDVMISGGWIEACTTGIRLADNPDVLRFWYGGSADQSPNSIASSNNRSILLPDGNGHFRLAGRWMVEALQASQAPGSIRQLRNFQLAACGLASGWVSDPANATPDVSYINRLALGYTAAATVTGFTGTPTAGQLLAVVAGNTSGVVQRNASIALAEGDWMPQEAGEVLLLMYDPSFQRWAELSRSAPKSGVIHRSTTTASTDAGTAEKDLWAQVLRANLLNKGGSGIRILAWGTCAANPNAKTLRLYFGSNLILTTTTSLTSATHWRLEAEVFRIGAYSQKATAAIHLGSVAFDTESSAPTQTLANAITVRVTGQNGTANAGDVTFEGGYVELLP